MQGDVQSQEQMEDLVNRTLERWGGIDILVASAGGAGGAQDGRPRKATGLFHQTDPLDVAESVARSHLGKLIPTRAVVEHMISRNTGSILFITSEGGRFPTPSQTSTSLAAGGLVMMSKVLAKELSRYKIRVNTIAVTLVEDTPSWNAFSSGTFNEVRMSNFAKIREKRPLAWPNHRTSPMSLPSWCQMRPCLLPAPP